MAPKLGAAMIAKLADSVARIVESSLAAWHLPAFLVRIDDYGDRDPHTERLLSSLTAAQLAADIAAIPAHLTPAGIHAIERRASAQGARIRIHQHGWRHQNHERTGKKAEFGSSRSAEQQRANLIAGRDRLRSLFGELFTDVFCPPWNRLTPVTVRCVEQLGYEGISAFGAVDAPGMIADLSATLDWTRCMKHAPDAVAGGVLTFLDCVESGRAFIVMVHPSSSEEEASRLLQLLTLLRDGGAASLLFNDMLTVKACSTSES